MLQGSDEDGAEIGGICLGRCSCGGLRHSDCNSDEPIGDERAHRNRGVRQCPNRVIASARFGGTASCTVCPYKHCAKMVTMGFLDDRRRTAPYQGKVSPGYLANSGFRSKSVLGVTTS